MKKSKFDIITIGAAVRDIFLFLNPSDVFLFDNPNNDPTCKKLLGLEYGAKIHAASSKLAFGGGALNTAITFSRHGLATATITSLGCDDTGEAIIHLLERENINQEFVSYHSRSQTGFSVLVVDKATGEHVALVERGANDLFNFSARAHKLSSAPWCYLTSLTGEHWQVSMDKIINTVKNNKIKLAWNPGNEQLERGWETLIFPDWLSTGLSATGATGASTGAAVPATGASLGACFQAKIRTKPIMPTVIQMYFVII